MRIAICDDEEYILSQIEEYAIKYSKKNNRKISIIKFDSGNNLLKYFSARKDIDILFLDINMSGINGIEVAHIIRSNDSSIKIFLLTAMHKYALEGYYVKAERYLIKPLRFGQFEKELTCVVKAMELENNRFFIEKNDKGIFKVKLSEIIYIETVGRNTLIHMISDNIISYRSMKEHEELLDKSFIRCHRAYIVNLAYVSTMIDAKIVLSNDEKILLSKYRKNIFKEALLDYYGDLLYTLN